MHSYISAISKIVVFVMFYLHTHELYAASQQPLNRVLWSVEDRIERATCICIAKIRWDSAKPDSELFDKAVSLEIDAESFVKGNYDNIKNATARYRSPVRGKLLSLPIKYDPTATVQPREQSMVAGDGAYNTIFNSGKTGGNILAAGLGWLPREKWSETKLLFFTNVGKEARLCYVADSADKKQLDKIREICRSLNDNKGAEKNTQPSSARVLVNMSDFIVAGQIRSNNPGIRASKETGTSNSMQEGIIQLEFRNSHFIKGQSSAFPKVATASYARDLMTRRPTSYNPLFIYGKRSEEVSDKVNRSPLTCFSQRDINPLIEAAGCSWLKQGEWTEKAYYFYKMQDEAARLIAILPIKNNPLTLEMKAVLAENQPSAK